MIQILTVCALLTLLPAVALAGSYEISLNAWTLTLQNETTEYNTRIPSTLSLDLIDNRLISSNPYYRDNFLKFYDYETKDASYTAYFSLPKQYLSSVHQLIVFEGLDTHAKVYLNGEWILQAHNMFRTYEVKVNLKEMNLLRVYFTSSAKWDLQQQAEFKNKFGFGLPQNYSFTRKAAYQYGWDWGPRILTMGIWKEVKVKLYNNSRIESIRFYHDPILKLSNQIKINLDLNFSELTRTAYYNFTSKVTKLSNNQIIQNNSNIFLANDQTYQLGIQSSISIDNDNTVWWTWDLGKQNLIKIDVTLTNLNDSETISSSMTTGIRTIQVVQDNRTFNGTSFNFNLNGYDIYMRGGNYIPPEMSLARTNKSTYQKIAKDALFAKFNMIRVWGGGQFEKDEFYQAMDEAGILIWHDLMFACALYPSSDDILSNIAAEMRDNVRRIRRHPSLALWNGNNEVWIGWQEWGWKQGLTEQQKQLVEKMYSDVFQNVLPSVLKEEHPEVFYWQTSPSVSASSPSAIFNSGDIHFWRVWGGGTKIQEYEYYIGRFNSEYGMQSMPEMSSIQQFTAPQDLSINSYILRLHQRHIYGDKYLPQYTFDYAGTTSNLARYSYFSQVMQAYALEMAIVSLRLNKPYNMGSLYWQLNDVWPVSSWATVDYYGAYKAAHYRIRQVYQELMIHTLHDSKTGDYVVYIVNQHNKTYYCHCTLAIETYQGETQQTFTLQRTVPAFQRVLVRRFLSNQSSKLNTTAFLKTKLQTTEGNISSNNYFLIPMKQRPSPLPDLRYTIENNKIRVSSDKLASYVWIYRKQNGNYIHLHLDENYFTLTAKEQKVVEIGNVPANQIFVTCYEKQIAEERKARQTAKLTSVE